MKLRIRGDSIRLRLGEREVAQLAQQGRITESTRFSADPENHLTCVLATSAEASKIGADFSGSVITVTVPREMCRIWAGSHQVGMEQDQRLDDSSTLAIVIEKDFKCLEPRPGEDQSDAFPNPADGKACGPGS